MNNELKQNFILAKSLIIEYFSNKIPPSYIDIIIKGIDKYTIKLNNKKESYVAAVNSKHKKIKINKNKFFNHDEFLQLISIIHEYLHVISREFSKKGSMPFIEEGMADFYSKEIGELYLKKNNYTYSVFDTKKVGYGEVTEVVKVLLYLLKINGISNPEYIYYFNHYDKNGNDNFIDLIINTIPNSKHLIDLMYDSSVFVDNSNTNKTMPLIKKELQNIASFYPQAFSNNALYSKISLCYSNELFYSLCMNNITFQNVFKSHNPHYVLYYIKTMLPSNVSFICNKSFYSEDMKYVISRYIESIQSYNDVTYLKTIITYLPTSLMEQLISKLISLGFEETKTIIDIKSTFKEYVEYKENGIKVGNYRKVLFSKSSVIDSIVLGDNQKSLTDTFIYLSISKVNDDNYQAISRLIIQLLVNEDLNKYSFDNNDHHIIATRIMEIITYLTKKDNDNSPDTIKLLSIIKEMFINNSINNHYLAISKILINKGIKDQINIIEKKLVTELINIRIMNPSVIKHSNYIELIKNIKLHQDTDYNLIININTFNEYRKILIELIRYTGYVLLYQDNLYNSLLNYYRKLPIDEKVIIGDLLVCSIIYPQNTLLINLRSYIVDDLINKELINKTSIYEYGKNNNLVKVLKWF